MTNLLGGNLHIGKLQGTDNSDVREDNRFEVKTIKAIGTDIETTMNTLRDGDKYYFTYHTIAWMPPISDEPSVKPTQKEIRAKMISGEIKVEDLAVTEEVPEFDNPENIVFDACLRFVKGENDEVLESAAGIKLGAKDDQGYRAELSTNCGDEGIVRCTAQPATVRVIRVV